MHNIVFREKAIQHLGKEVVLYTTDGPDFETYLKYGKIPGVYATVDFGAGKDPEAVFHQQRLAEPHGNQIYVNLNYIRSHAKHIMCNNLLQK